jgi:hypothetical protein
LHAIELVGAVVSVVVEVVVVVVVVVVGGGETVVVVVAAVVVVVADDAVVVVVTGGVVVEVAEGDTPWLSTTEKSSIVTEPFRCRPIPAERFAIPLGTTGVTQLTCLQVELAGTDVWAHQLYEVAAAPTLRVNAKMTAEAVDLYQTLIVKVWPGIAGAEHVLENPVRSFRSPLEMLETVSVSP